MKRQNFGFLRYVFLRRGGNVLNKLICDTRVFFFVMNFSLYVCANLTVNVSVYSSVVSQCQKHPQRVYIYIYREREPLSECKGVSKTLMLRYSRTPRTWQISRFARLCYTLSHHATFSDLDHIWRPRWCRTILTENVFENPQFRSKTLHYC